MYPSYIDNTNFKYLNIDNKYLINLVISSYPKYISFLEVLDFIPKNVSYDMNVFIDKKDSVEILKKLTYHISSAGSEIETINKNQLDIDLINKIQEDAKKIRKDIQINNEEIFFVNIFFTFYSKDKKELLSIVKNFQSKLFSKQIILNIANFRHLDYYLLSLPTNNKSSQLLTQNYRNMTTSTLCNFFPFYTKSIFDKNGIVFGNTFSENKLCNIDIFSDKYLNSNMCILGSSGSGKSYFTKLLIIRHFFKQKKQYIFDPEGEYIEIVKKLKGIYIDLSNSNKTYNYNIMDIEEYEIILNKENFLNEKVEKILKILVFLLDVESPKSKNILKKAIIDSYRGYNVYQNIECLYKKSNDENIYFKKTLKTDFPTFIDVLNNIDNKKIKEEFKIKIIDKYPNICYKTDFEKKNQKLIVFNLNNSKNKESYFLIEYFLNEVYMKIKSENKQQSIIYLDEIWKYIVNIDSNVLDLIFNLFKTLRKNKASIVTITQDISDFFSIKNGNYGKSILNNSGFKVFFKLEYSDNDFLRKISILNEANLLNIGKLDKSQAMLAFKNQVVNINIKKSDFEKKIIEGGWKNENSSSFK